MSIPPKYISILFKNRIRILLLLSAGLVLLFSSKVKITVCGDLIDYILMTESFENHLSPHLTENDTAEAKIMMKKDKIKLDVPYPFSTYYRADSGKYYCYHFWFYSLLCMPMKAFFNIIGHHQSRAFVVMNLSLFLLALWCAALLIETERIKKIFIILFLAINPVIWYITWIHTEVFSYSMVVIALTLFYRKRMVPAILFASLGALQNQPLLILSFYMFMVFIVEKFKDLKSGGKNNFADFSLAVLALMVSFIPAFFYYYNFGAPNMIVKCGHASLKNMSLVRCADLFFNTDMGLLYYFPIMCILFFIVVIKTALQRNLKDFFLTLTVFVMVLLSTQTINWNSGMAGLARYAIWIIPVIVFVVIQNMRINTALTILFIISLVFQLFLIIIGGGLRCKIDYCAHNTLSQFLLKNCPILYSPDFSVFAERTKGFEMSYRQNLPVIFDSNKDVTKILSNYDSLKKIEESCEILNPNIYAEKIAKFKPESKKAAYINLTKGILRLKETKIHNPQ